MNRMLAIAVGGGIAALNVLGAQDSAADSTAPNQVTAVSIRSGKLALSSAANPGPVFLPDGAYRNDANTVIVILDGRIIRVEYGSGTVTQVASSRVQRGRVMLTPPVTALMSVSPFPLPGGTFTHQDGAAWVKIVSAMPTEFVVRAPN